MPITIDTSSSDYTERSLWLAAISEQIALFGGDQAEGETKNNNNTRIFESPKILEEGDMLTVSADAHTSEGQFRFNEFIEKAVKESAWDSVREQHPFYDITKTERLYATKSLAHFLAKFVDIFRDLWKEIDAILSEKRPELLRNLEPTLILMIATFLKMQLTPKAGNSNEELNRLYAIFISIENKVTNLDYMEPKPEGTIDSCCQAMMRLISLSITQAIGQEKPYGGMLGVAEGYLPLLLLDADDDKEAYQFFAGKQHYLISELSFEAVQPEDEEEFLWRFLEKNLSFLDQIDSQHCPKSLCQITIQRLWEAFVKDPRCPSWVKRKEDVLREKIINLPVFLLMELDKLKESIDKCDKKDDQSLETLARTGVKQLFHRLAVDTDGQIDREAVSRQLNALSVTYKSEKNFHAQLCFSIISRVNSALANIGNTKSQEEINHVVDKQQNIVESAIDRSVHILDKPDLVFSERQGLLDQLFRLRGAIPEECFGEKLAQLHEKFISCQCLFQAALCNEDLALVQMTEKLKKQDGGTDNSAIFFQMKEKVNVIANTAIKRAILNILGSALSNEEKFHAVFNIADGKCQRVGLRYTSTTRHVYQFLRKICQENMRNHSSSERYDSPSSSTAYPGFFNVQSRSPSPNSIAEPPSTPIKGLC